MTVNANASFSWPRFTGVAWVVVECVEIADDNVCSRASSCTTVRRQTNCTGRRDGEALGLRTCSAEQPSLSRSNGRGHHWVGNSN